MTLDEYTQIMDDIAKYRADCEFVNEYEEPECRQCNANVFGSIERMIEKHKGDGWHTKPPEESGEYLVTWTWDGERPALGICEYEIDELVPDGMWWPEAYMKSYPGWKVVAWMPLPDAYKGVEDETG